MTSLDAFTNKPYVNFNDPAIRTQMDAALGTLESTLLGRKWPHVFLGKEIGAGNGSIYTSDDPNDPSVTIGTFQGYDPTTMDLDGLLSGAQEASRLWNALGIGIRAEVIEIAADLMEQDIMLISSGMVRETGKSFIEAYADACEAIDFLRYDALLAREIYAKHPTRLPPTSGDFNRRVIVPHGVFLTEDPFNFQVAIGTDQIAKPLLMGNSVIASPSDKSSLCGRMVYDLFEKAFHIAEIENNGILNWVPGGSDIADPLLSNPKLAGLALPEAVMCWMQLSESMEIFGEVMVVSWSSAPPKQAELIRFMSIMMQIWILLQMELLHLIAGTAARNVPVLVR